MPSFKDISSGTFKIHATNTQVNEERGDRGKLDANGKDKIQVTGCWRCYSMCQGLLPQVSHRRSDCLHLATAGAKFAELCSYDKGIGGLPEVQGPT